MKKLNILLSTPHSGIQTGSGMQLHLLARELVKRGHRVVAAFKKDLKKKDRPHPTLSRFEGTGVEVIRIPFAKLKYSYTLPVLTELGNYLWEERFDVVHSFAGMDFNYFFILSFFVPVPALISNRGTNVKLDIFNSIKYRQKRVKRILTVSEAVRETMMKSGRIAPDKIDVCYSASDLAEFDPAMDGKPVRAELGIPEGVQVVGTIGSLRFSPGHLKGGIELLEAAKRVLDTHPQTRFLLVGSINRDKFMKAAEPLGIADKFVLAGFRQDVARMLSACDLTVVPSIRAEGLAGVIRESLAMKKPVIATNVGGNGELVEDGRTGVLVEPGDPAEIAEGVRELLDSREKLERLGEAGRTRVEQCCSLKARVDRIEDLYYRSLEGSPEEFSPDFLMRSTHAIAKKLFIGRMKQRMSIPKP